MDLANLGQIAGLAGIAVGAAVLVFRTLVEKGLGGLPPKDRGAPSPPSRFAPSGSASPGSVLGSLPARKAAPPS